MGIKKDPIWVKNIFFEIRMILFGLRKKLFSNLSGNNAVRTYLLLKTTKHLVLKIGSNHGVMDDLRKQLINVLLRTNSTRNCYFISLVV